MATLLDRKVSDTYKGVLNIDNSNAGIDGTIRYVQDGEGTASVLGLSTTGVTVNGTMKIGTYTIAPTGNITTAGALTTSGAFSTSGAYSLTFTLTANTNLTLPTSGTFVTSDNIVTLTNKTLTAPIINDPSITVSSNAITLPATAQTLVGRTTTDTLTNKTLTAPIIATISNTGTITLPTSTTTLVGRDTTDTLTNKTLTSPKIGTSILDTNGNELLKVTATASAVNEMTLTNAATGGNPTLAVTGDDANIEMHFTNKGAGYYRFNGTASNPARLLLMEDTDSGTDGIILQPISAVTTTRTIQLPDADGYVALDTASTGAWTGFTPGFTGFSANPSSVVAAYKKIGNSCFIRITMTAGTSNATGFTITSLPFSAVAGQHFSCGTTTNNSLVTWGTASISGTTITVSQTGTTTWTASGTKGTNLNFIYETA